MTPDQALLLDWLNQYGDNYALSVVQETCRRLKHPHDLSNAKDLCFCKFRIGWKLPPHGYDAAICTHCHTPIIKHHDDDWYHPANRLHPTVRSEKDVYCVPQLFQESHTAAPEADDVTD